MRITNRRRFGRRASKAALAFCLLRSSAAQGATVDPECTEALDSLFARLCHYVRSSTERNIAHVDPDALITPSNIEAKVNWMLARQQLWLDLD